MRSAGGRPLELSLVGDKEILILRRFAAARELVFEAFTSAEMIARWMLGPGGWTMPICEVDLRPGGAYRHVWRKDGERDLAVSGTYVEVEAPRRIVARERFSDDWTQGDTLITTEFESEQDGGTLVRMTIEYSSAEARDAASRTGMADGMEAGYVNLDVLFAGRG
ncbi:MAG: SRPBCC domain-containing protein [Trueperaceae bacterium]|nr:SRPBCC domain-containing protein [Trueperaceae bacterium]